MSARQTTKLGLSAPSKDAPDAAFAKIVRSSAAHDAVTTGGKGFGSGALKVNGKIFAMTTPKGEFVVKLSKPRADELVAPGKGSYFDPGHGRLMKQWVVVLTTKSTWLPFAREGWEYVGE